ncbi:MAG: hypothetical protein ASARMPREDX12_000951 [Alectoria sarmentosa]|nr:MAG: hypothetical protein ASARMPREDX12_000951 [Alectoria sarmentosa]
MSIPSSFKGLSLGSIYRTGKISKRLRLSPLGVCRKKSLIDFRVGELFPPPFYKFWDGDSPSSVLAATDFIASSISYNKPDVIFAHSEGGAGALSALLRHPHNVKCLVLVNAFPPFDASGRRRLDVSISGTPISVPTLFVHGKSDPMGYFVNLTKGLVDERNLTTYSWNGGHEMPNSGERGMWAQIAQKAVEILKES